MYFVIDYLYGTIEKINGSKDRYLVINKDSLINEKNINFFYYLWNTIINKIKYSRGDDNMFDDNEVIIKENQINININNLYFVVDYLYGPIEKINGSKDRYLVINKNSLIDEKNINFLKLFMEYYY